MRMGKKPTAVQRKALQKLDLDPADWLVVSWTERKVILRDRHSDEIRTVTYGEERW